jgi:phage-related protein
MDVVAMYRFESAISLCVWRGWPLAHSDLNARRNMVNQFWYNHTVRLNLPKLAARFFQESGSSNEPVREWLKTLTRDERRAIGADIQTVQFSWPIGKPLADHIDGDIWEMRTRLDNRIARILFVIQDGTVVLLHGFIKKTQKTPSNELDIAKQRFKRLRGR